MGRKPKSHFVGKTLLVWKSCAEQPVKAEFLDLVKEIDCWFYVVKYENKQTGFINAESIEDVIECKTDESKKLRTLIKLKPVP